MSKEDDEARKLPQRERLANHMDTYVHPAGERGRFRAYFECCSTAMIEVALMALTTLPPAEAAAGIVFRLECSICHKKIRGGMWPDEDAALPMALPIPGNKS